MTKQTIGIAIVGCGGITLQNHLPGLALCGDTRVVALCDTNPDTLETAARETGASVTSANYEDVVRRDDVDAVIIATLFHKPIALDAIAHGKHVLCEKPLAMTYEDAREMAAAADAANVRHMTAFTYRFVPAMRYLAHLIARGDLGQPYHYRSCRLQDWEMRNLGWRQIKKLAGTGELGDMLSHRIDFALSLVGPMKRLVAQTKLIIEDRQGAVSDLEDWVAIIAEFQNGTTGVLESSKLARGRSEGWRSLDWVEMNGSEGTFEFTTGKWNELQYGKAGGPGLKTLPVPREFWVVPGFTRDPGVGDPLITFRYDQAFEFIDAIRNQRPCTPSFHDGARTQHIIDSALQSVEKQAWVNVGAA
jgi:predicted dehydrogenase